MRTGAPGPWDEQFELHRWHPALVHQLLRDAPPASLVSDAEGAAEPSAEEHALADVRYSRVGAALARLPQDLRVVMRATVVDGLTTNEAARLLGIPAGTVKTRMMRARIALREELA